MKKIFYFLLGSSVVMGILVSAGFVLANPLYFSGGVVTASATSTLAYLNTATAGTSTTPVYDALADNTGNAANSAVMLFQFTGSSTASVANIAFEYAMPPASGINCATTPTACDWYKDGLLGTGSTISTTTQVVNLAVATSFNVPFASTTVGGIIGTGSITTRILSVPTPTRFVRAVISLNPGSLNGAVWGAIIPVKQQP